MVFLNTCSLLAQGSSKSSRRTFLDSLRLLVKAGAGGMGQPKYGGVGGQGGDVFVVCNDKVTLKSVLGKNPSKRISAGVGENSHAKRFSGGKGQDVFIEVPPGVAIYSESGLKLGEVNKEGDKVLVAKGGLGGSPDTGFCGLKGQSHVVTLDLKLIADVGLVGFPNAGKSTLLSAISNAKPKIASYPFTTIQPSIGILDYPDLRRITAADLPGLIEGAHVNIGMGHKFLKHVERTKLLLVVADVEGFQLSHQYSARSCLETIILLNKELELYKEDLLCKPAMLVINKMDKPGADKIYQQVNESLRNIDEVFESLPEEIRPVQPFDFKRSIGISAKEKNPAEINEVKRLIRETLDIYCCPGEEQTGPFEMVDKLKEHGPKVL